MVLTELNELKEQRKKGKTMKKYVVYDHNYKLIGEVVCKSPNEAITSLGYSFCTYSGNDPHRPDLEMWEYFRVEVVECE